MNKLCIIGSNGFIGKHIILNIQSDLFIVSCVNRKQFNNTQLLTNKLLNSDVILYLASNNSNDELINANQFKQAKYFINVINKILPTSTLIYISSTSQFLNTPYGITKKTIRCIFQKEYSGRTISFIIPNVYGIGNKPMHNSVVSTFSFQAVNGIQQKIIINKELQLIYINDVIKSIINEIQSCLKTNETQNKKIVLSGDVKIFVSDLKNLINEIYSKYKENIFMFNNQFNINLTNIIISFIPEHLRFHLCNEKIDNRGKFVELIKGNFPGQISYITVNPGFVRGNHYHKRKFERFQIISGNGILQVENMFSKQNFKYQLNSQIPSYIDIIPYFNHKLINNSNDEMVCILYSNEIFDINNMDTYIL